MSFFFERHLSSVATPIRSKWSLFGKLTALVALMFGFGYALVPFYYWICEATGVNVLSLSEQNRFFPKNAPLGNEKNSQRDLSRRLTIEFDSNQRPTKPAVIGTSSAINARPNALAEEPLPSAALMHSLWVFKPEVASLEVHPGELTTVMYEFQNTENRRITAQAIPSYAPQQAGAYFSKVECFCFKQYTLEPGEKKQWPVIFYVDAKLPKEIKTITLSYTFFEIPSGKKT